MTRRRLMVVDDEPDMGDFVCAVAEGAGFEASCVHHGREFIEAVDRNVDVLVVDLFMPDVDGIELIRFLHQEQVRTPLILMSGVDKNVLHSARELATELGLQVLGSLNKPFRKTDLVDLLATASRVDPGPARTPQPDPDAQIAEADLRRALSNRELIPHFQPQFDMVSRSVVGAEALVRWQRPECGIVLPGCFIPLAERTGIIDDIDEVVLQHAVAQCRAWHDAGMPIRVSINFSPGTLKDLTFPDRLAALMAAHRLEPASSLWRSLRATRWTICPSPWTSSPAFA